MSPALSAGRVGGGGGGKKKGLSFKISCFYSGIISSFRLQFESNASTLEQRWSAIKEQGPLHRVEEENPDLTQGKFTIMSVLEDTVNLDILYTSKKPTHNVLLHIFFHPDIKPTLCCLPQLFSFSKFLWDFLFIFYFLTFFHAICPSSVCHLLCLLVIAVLFFQSQCLLFRFSSPSNLRYLRL